MTDPQNDVPCRDCKRPTQHATERCADCRTPAAMLLTELAALGIKGASQGDEEVTVYGYAVEIDDDGNWTIRDYTGEVDAANAIAAIVQAPDLRGIMDRMTIQAEESARLLNAQTALVAELRADRDATQTGIGALWDMLDRAGVRDDVDERYMQQVSEHCYEPAGEHRRADVLERVGLLVAGRDAVAAERDTLAAENERLVAELERHKPLVGPWTKTRDGWARYKNKALVTVDLMGWEVHATWVASGPETGDAGRHAADLALIAAGYRLIGGIHPAQGEVQS